MNCTSKHAVALSTPIDKAMVRDGVSLENSSTQSDTMVNRGATKSKVLVDRSMVEELNNLKKIAKLNENLHGTWNHPVDFGLESTTG